MRLMIDVLPALKIGDILNQSLTMTKFVINHPSIQKLFKSKAQFDLVFRVGA